MTQPTFETNAMTQDLLLMAKVAPHYMNRQHTNNDLNWRRVGAIALSGDDVSSLMRTYGWTIKRIAAEHGITQKRIREWRKHGLDGWTAVNAIWCITGVWIA